MWRNDKNIEHVCGRVFLALFLLALPAVWVRLFFGGKIDAFENESRFANEMPKVGAEAIWRGEFQTALESGLSDQMPGSETIRNKLLAFDDLIFDGLSWVSARKGSKYQLVADDMYSYDNHDYLLRPLLKSDWINFKNSDSETSKKIRDALEKSAKYYGSLSIENKFIYYVTTDQAIDFDNPESNYINDILSYYPSFKADYLEIPDFDTYAKYYLKNDHHWNYEGSYTGYKEIIKLMLGKDEKVLEPTEKVVFNYDAQGSKSRGAHFFEYKEKFTAYRFDLGEHVTKINGEIQDEYGSQNRFFNEPELRNGQGDITYGDFYGLDPAVVEIDYNQPDKPNLIMIGYSDTNAINNLVASHFNKTWAIDPRFCTRSEFEQIVSENKIDYLLLVPNTSVFIEEMLEEPKGYEGVIQ